MVLLWHILDVNVSHLLRIVVSGVVQVKTE